MPSDAQNAQSINSIFSGPPGLELTIDADDKETSGVTGAEHRAAADENPADDPSYETSIAPELDFKETTPSVEDAINTIGTPVSVAGSPINYKQPKTPVGETPGDQPVAPDATLLTIQSEDIEKKAIEGFTNSKVTTII